MSTRRFLIAGVLVALLLAGVASYYASESPDGLNRVAADHGLAGSEQSSPAADSPLADYSARGIEDPRLSGGLAGILGVGVVLLLASVVAFAVRRRDGT